MLLITLRPVKNFLFFSAVSGNFFFLFPFTFLAGGEVSFVRVTLDLPQVDLTITPEENVSASAS